MTARERTPTAAAVVLAGGSGTRLGGGVNKVYLPLAGRPILAWSLLSAHRAAASARIGRLLLVTRAADAEPAAALLRAELPDAEVELVVGGATRQESELAALAALAPAIEAGEIDAVAIHDGARPLASPDLWTAVLAAARAAGGAIPVLPADDVTPADGAPLASVSPAAGASIARVQTPQAFRARELLAAYRAAASAGFVGTDTAATVERFTSLRVVAVPGSRDNLKVTYPGDLSAAEAIAAAGAVASITGPADADP